MLEKLPDVWETVNLITMALYRNYGNSKPANWQIGEIAD